ncbi:MAG: phospholipid-binding protein MlaC [Aquincola tertiaricarbonis]|uniref:MlaC/ttg2D family ABC transporter substrate-binding protein n=1 Tax=Aquincola tertiaricarbonis TaxID=391953 RepID=UPI000614DE57|nr:ABC transporter substrate-binding protein [Aquincola tertiaricarbonis]
MFKPFIATLVTSVSMVGAFAQQAPDAFVKDLANDVVDAVKADKAIQAGDISKINALVDTRVMPHVNFERMTSRAVGEQRWNSASADQKAKLQAEFKTLLVRSYAGALREVKPATTVALKPFRGAATDKEVEVQTEVRGAGQPVALNYRLENGNGGWKIYDVNVAGFWLVPNYTKQFAPILQQGGVDGLLGKLGELNKSAAGAKS